jgi:hypothetical protein
LRPTSNTLLQVLQQHLHALRDALALRLERLAQRLGVEREEVARARGVDPLLHREAHALARLLVALERLGQLHHRARVEQVQLREVSRRRVGGPVLAGEAAVGQGLALVARCGLQPLERRVPKGGSLFQVVALQLRQGLGRQAQARERLPGLGHGGAEGLRGVAVRRRGRRGAGRHGVSSVVGAWPPSDGAAHSLCRDFVPADAYRSMTREIPKEHARRLAHDA